MIETLMHVRLRLYVMILQKRYCQASVVVCEHMTKATDLQHELNLFGKRNEYCMFAVARIGF
jgi:hypothetical protein